MTDRVSLAGQLLVAMPRLADPNFFHTVVLVCQHDEGGAMGVIVNRESSYRLGDLLDQMHIVTRDSALAGQPVLLGGPVNPESGFVLHDDGSTWGASLAVRDSLVLTSSRDVLEAMARGEGPPRALLALGYAGWAAGQLEQELIEDSWLVVPADVELLFDLALEQRWQAAAARLGVDPSRVADYSGHA